MEPEELKRRMQQLFQELDEIHRESRAYFPAEFFEMRGGQARELTMDEFSRMETLHKRKKAWDEHWDGLWDLMVNSRRG